MLTRLQIGNRLRNRSIVGNSLLNFQRSLASQVPHTPSNNEYPNYSNLLSNLEKYYKLYNPKGLTLTEKILFAHLRELDPNEAPKRGDTYLKLRPDRVAMQDASAQMAVLQFMLCGKAAASVPTSIHCDHLIRAHQGANADVASALVSEKEIFEFLESSAKKYGMQFWRPGSGIIHQIVLENYASPGGLMLGTDSHTPNAGGLGIMAIGVGGADAVDAMADIPWELKFPQVLGVHLKGELNGWTSPKDVILHLAGQLTVRGGTGYVIEYFGPGVKSLSCTGMATMCNMGAEVGATTSLFPFNESMEKYLLATRRGDLADICRGIQGKYLSADPEVHQNPGDYYDKIIEIDLSKLEPHINGPFSPDLSYPLSKFKDIVQQNGWKDEVKAGLIGSCTNSSYQDMSRAASVAQQAINQGLEIPKETQFLITPGSEQIRATVERDGQIETLSKLGGQVLANACGPCIGQWKRTDLEDPKSPNAIVTSFNRNFRGRNDGSPNTLNFLASPEIVTAMTIAGKLSFNPLTDYIQTSEGNKVKLQPPKGDDLPSSGFELGNTSFRPEQGLLPQKDAAINVNPESDRLQLLEPFAKWDGQELGNLKVLLKAEGKCTTDHISAAGPWLKYKGHLENISNNTLIGAKSANTQKVNEINNFFTNTMDTIPNVAKDYLKRGQPWMVVTDHNYGEGSAREHAAMQPRYLGCQVILARSFARIHQTNLKKQGVLPLTFVNEKDYELINEGDVVFTKGVTSLAPGSKISVIVHKQGNPNDVIEIDVEHSMSKDQIDWFKAGSALNFIAEQNRS